MVSLSVGPVGRVSNKFICLLCLIGVSEISRGPDKTALLTVHVHQQRATWRSTHPTGLMQATCLAEDDEVSDHSIRHLGAIRNASGHPSLIWSPWQGSY